ncbi:MAG: hypothetical protein ACF8QF_02040 [Phycisphaerales bacterium]
MIDRLFDLIQSNPGSMLPIILGLPGMVCAVAIVWIASVASVKGTREKEKARREIAAYVAEGSMTAEDGERLLNPSPWYSRGGAEKWGEDIGRCVGSAKRAAREAARDKSADPQHA